MTTKAEIGQLLRPFLDGRDDLILIDQQLILRPVRHLYKGVTFDRTRERNRFRLYAGISPFCGRLTDVTIGEGIPIVRPDKKLWFLDDPSSQHDLFHAIETIALPFLRSVETLVDFANLPGRKPLTDMYPLNWYVSQLTWRLAAGDLDWARWALETKLHVYDPHSQDPVIGGRGWEHNVQYARLLAPLAASDIPAMAAILHEFEAFSVKNLKLERYWEPTPFPLEELA